MTVPWVWYCPRCEALVPNKLVKFRRCIYWHHYDPASGQFCPAHVEKIEVR